MHSEPSRGTHCQVFMQLPFFRSTTYVEFGKDIPSLLTTSCSLYLGVPWIKEGKTSVPMAFVLSQSVEVVSCVLHGNILENSKGDEA